VRRAHRSWAWIGAHGAPYDSRTRSQAAKRARSPWLTIVAHHEITYASQQPPRYLRIMPRSLLSQPSAPIAVLAALAAMIAAAGEAGGADRSSAEVLVRPCAGCHGTGGVSVGPTTSNLAGQPAAYLVAAMRAYRSGERPATVMDRIARAYDDREIDAMGAYFQRQPLTRSDQQTDPVKRVRGASLHQRLCVACHRDGGRRFEYEGEAGPRLAGQWVDYLNAAIRQYFARDRDMPLKMGWQLLQLGPGDAEALAHFYASQE
jgi:sulfide dehydrogenase cytochrome subunit